MQLIPVIIRYPDTPFSVSKGHEITAGRMVQDVGRVFNRITKRAMDFTTQAVVLDATENMEQELRNGSVRNSSAGWWDAWAILRANGFDEATDVYCVWHANRLTDVTGIGQPAAPHDFDDYLAHEGAEPEISDPAIGGIACNGFGQIADALEVRWQGEHYRNLLLYATHEVGHALGRHHTPHPDTGLSDPVYNALNSIMGYGYANFAGGYRNPNPMLAVPAEIMTWREHSIFHDIPERWTGKDPGWADDLVLMRAQDQRQLLAELDTPDGRGRLLIGATTAELNDPFE